MTIGQRIAYKRKELALSQEALGESLGVSRQAVSKWERGVCLPDVSLYMELCEILGITINEFIAGEDLQEETFVEKSDENIISSGRLDSDTDKLFKLFHNGYIADDNLFHNRL